MPTHVFNNKSEFDNRPDKFINGVSAEFAYSRPNYKEDNETNISCWNCSNCINCYECSNCDNCHNSWFLENMRDFLDASPRHNINFKHLIYELMLKTLDKSILHGETKSPPAGFINELGEKYQHTQLEPEETTFNNADPEK